MQRLAIVVPTLDEERALRQILPQLGAIADEIVVSDGGSTDGTVEVARSGGAVVVTGGPGRGPQLNRGARATSAEILLFLHADTSLPAEATAAVRRAIEEGADGGGFQVRFDVDRAIFRFAARAINLRTRMSRAPLGDQAHFVTKATFDTLGGYRDWPILEDLDFALRLRRHGKSTVLPHRVTTSARRYVRRGFTRTVGTNWLIWTLFLMGVSPHRLVRLYRQVR